VTLEARLRTRAQAAVLNAAADLQANLRQAAPFQSNRMRLNTFAQPRGLRVQVSVEVDYASFTNDGTPPHIIRGSPILSFFWPKLARRVFYRYVHHPGTRRTGWYDDTIARWPALVSRRLTAGG
jgi:hypothetical protein